MKLPEHPAGPAFEKAADAQEAWRQQQVAALTETQRHIYEQARREAKRREEAKAKELAQRRDDEIRAHTRRKLIEAQSIEFSPHGSKRKRLSERQIDRLIAQLLQPGHVAPVSMGSSLASQAYQAAVREIDAEHEREREEFRDKEQSKLDFLLRKFERAREIDLGQAKTEFTPAARGGSVRSPVWKQAIARADNRLKKKEKTKADFQKAAQPRSDRQDAAKSKAVSHAIANVKAKQDKKHSREDRKHDTGRSLRDEFNKAR